MGEVKKNLRRARQRQIRRIVTLAISVVILGVLVIGLVLWNQKENLGNNNEDNNEGYNYKNFYGTYLIGPFLVFNPYFMKHIKSILNDENLLPFEEETIDAYNFRLKEFEDPKTSMISKH